MPPSPRPERAMFMTANVDRSTLIALHDLRGFWSPLGFRVEDLPGPKELSAIVHNFYCFCNGDDNDQNDDRFILPCRATYTDLESMAGAIKENSDQFSSYSIVRIITIELQHRDNSPFNLKFQATAYNDRLYKPAQDFKLLMNGILS